MDRTPKPFNQTIEIKASSETLRDKLKSPAAGSALALQEKAASAQTQGEATSLALKLGAGLGLAHKKQKRLEKQREEREELRQKEAAHEAMRKKHGDVVPPGQAAGGQIHTHRHPPHHDHHRLERSRSFRNGRHVHQNSHLNSSPSRVASPTPSSSSSAYSSSRHRSLTREASQSRPTSPAGEIGKLPLESFSQFQELQDLNAEVILSQHQWNDSSDEHEEDIEVARTQYRRGRRERWTSTNDQDPYTRNKDSLGHRNSTSSFRSNASSAAAGRSHLSNRPLSPASSALSRQSSRTNRSTVSFDLQGARDQLQQLHYERIAQHLQATSDSDSNNASPPEHQSYHKLRHHKSLDMTDARSQQNQSWPFQNNNASTIGIVTGLAPELSGHHDIPRPSTSQSHYRSEPRRHYQQHPRHYRPETPTRDPIVERYLYNARPQSPGGSSVHRHYHQAMNIGSNIESGTAASSSDQGSSSATATEVIRAKAGSRAGGTYQGPNSTADGGAGKGYDDNWSDHGTRVSTDEHNYLPPLPPFQMGPAYTRTPKRKYCTWCFGGVRLWVLLLLIFIMMGILAAVAVFFYYKFGFCKAIEPNSVQPFVYTLDPGSVQGLALEFQTQTKGVINIVESPDVNQTKVVLKLQRQFYRLQDRRDLTGFRIETLSNGYTRYILHDDANDHRDFFVSSVLCSESILTIEMPRPIPGRSDIALDVQLDQQDVHVMLDDTTPRNSTWKFRGASNQNMHVKSLNINSLSISYTSTSPSTVTLDSIIVRSQLSVVSVSGDIKASVKLPYLDSGSGPGQVPPTTTNSTVFPSSNSTTTATRALPTGSSSPLQKSPSTVNLQTLNGEIQLDLKTWNQTGTFQIDSPSIQISKANVVIMDNDDSKNQNTGVLPPTNQTGVSQQAGLTVHMGQNSVWGVFYNPASPVAPPVQPPNALNTTTNTPPGTATRTTTTAGVSLTGSGTLSKPTTVGTATGSGVPPTAVPATTTTATAVITPGPSLVPGENDAPARLMIQANKRVGLNFS
ncbi:hypothetical protein BGW38_010855 [Lunasporangiospora selenospora]|uniref:Uncharacterized protein n=1 Tax=Lunasporangiospora selenospora TaxID=979761 RepID=A0A9P6FW69_9FUNG|nr:hypothetical protein BGW38_010855 [Lunasporangiospora selenospora]